MLDALPHAVAVTALAGGTGYLNGPAAALVGLAPGPVDAAHLAATLRAVAATAPDPTVVAGLDAALDDPDLVRSAWTWQVAGDGDASPWRWLRVHTTPLPAGVPAGRLWVFEDVTAEHAGLDAEQRARSVARAERAMREAALESMLDPYVLLEAVRDAADTIVDFAVADANPAACTYLRRSRADLLGARLLDLLPGHAPTGLLDRYARVIETGEPLVLDDYAYDHEIAGPGRRYDVRAVRVGEALSYTWRDVTDRAEAAERLAESERRFRLVAENSSDVVYLAGPDRRVRWISPNVATALGWSAEELHGTRMFDLVHPEDRPVLHDLRERLYALDLPPSVNAVVRIRCRDGEYVWMSLRATGVPGVDGRLETAVVGMRNVDDLIAARRRAEADEELLRVSADALPDPQTLVGVLRDGERIVDFAFLDVNRATCEYTGLDRERLVGMRLLDAWPGLAEAGLLQQLTRVIETGKPLVLNDWAYHNEVLGASRRYDLRAARVSGDRMSLTWRDVTERYEASARIAESEERFRLLAENASDVVVLLRRGVVQWVSPSLERTLGWSPAQWSGQRLATFIHPDDQVLAEERHAEIVAGATRITRLRVRHAGGRFHWVEIHASPALPREGTEEGDGSGHEHGVVASFRTVDDVIAYERELERRARYDDLTGVLKRDSALNHLAGLGGDARLPGGDPAVVFVDLDDFKRVNDTHGHLAGDEVLRAVADRIRASVRHTDLVARMGGDEFLVVLHGIHDLAEATSVAETVRRRVAQPVAVPGGSVTVTVSVGVTLRRPGELPDALIARADRAMYTAKDAGRDRVVAISPG